VESEKTFSIIKFPLSIEHCGTGVDAVTNFSGKNLNAACGGPQGGGMDSRRNGVAEVSPNYLAEMASSTISLEYKQTEVGVIPEDWDVIQLGDCASYVGAGKTNTKSRGEYPLYGSTGLIGSCERPEYSGESLLVARVGANAGRLNYVCGEYGVSDNTILIKTKPDHSIGFFKYWLIWKNLNTLVFGSGQPLITGTQLKELALPLPSKTEQTAIANALSDVDALISELEKLIAKKQAIKTATMQQLLTGRTRLPQFALRDDGTPKGTKPSELGEIPEDWEVVELGKLLAYEQPTNYLISHTKFLDEGLYPVLTAGKSFILGYTNEEHGVFTNLPVIIFDDFTTDSKFVDFPFKAKSSAMKMLKPINKNTPLSLIYNLLNSVDYLVGDHKRHWIGEFQFLNVAIPSKENEQTAIATILSDMGAEIQALEQRLGKTRQIKKGMMQELLTGKTRLVQPLNKE